MSSIDRPPLRSAYIKRQKNRIVRCQLLIAVLVVVAVILLLFFDAQMWALILALLCIFGCYSPIHRMRQIKDQLTPK